MVSLHTTVPSYLHTFVLSTFPYFKKGFQTAERSPDGPRLHDLLGAAAGCVRKRGRGGGTRRGYTELGCRGLVFCVVQDDERLGPSP